MNATIAVFRQELGERKRVFIVAVAIAILPFLIATLPSLAGQRDMAIASISIYAAVVYSLALALAVGSSMIARPLAEKRLSFYLARPIPIAALWGGKLTANLLTCFAAALIIAVPSVLVAFDAAQTHWRVAGDGLSAVVLVGVPFLMLTAHYVATFTRSRSIRLVADFVLLVVAVYVMIRVIRPVVLGGAVEAGRMIALFFGLALAVTLLFAPLWQLARGRADIRRSHAALSTALWVAVAGILTGVAGYATWVTRAPLSSIRTWGGSEQTPDGTKLIATGESTRGGFYVSYLVDTQTGESRRLKELAPWGEVYISRDGSTVVTQRLTELLPRRGDSELVLTPLDARGVSGVIASPGRTTGVTMTADARRIAVANNGAVTVYDSASGSMLGAARVDGRLIHRMFFLSPTCLRLITTNGRGRESAIDELDLTTKTLRRTGVLAEGSDGGWIVASADYTRMLRRARAGDREMPAAARGATVVDGRTGAALLELPPMFAHALLNDGRVVSVEKGEPHGKLHLYAADGALEKSIDLPVARAMFLGQSGSSTVLLRSGGAVLVADLGRGTIRRIAASVWPSYRDAQLTNYPEGALLAGLDADKKLALWSLSKGERQELP